MAAHHHKPALRCALCSLTLLALAAGCSSNTRQLLNQAEASWRRGRYYEAIQDNEALYRLERRGKYAARALLNLGNIYYLNLRQVNQASEFYSKLTQEFPDRAEALEARRQLAVIYANEFHDPDQAIAQYDTILESKDLDDRPEILYQRADIYFKKGDYDRALRELRNLEESGISGHLADRVALKIGNIYQLRKNFADAIEMFQKVLTAPCTECRRRAILNLAETYESVFEFNKAIETINRLDKTPENEKFIQNEITRLNEKRKKLDSSAWLSWELPRTGDSASADKKAPPAGKRGKAPAEEPNRKETESQGYRGSSRMSEMPYDQFFEIVGA